jgi:ClpP class serine protease
MRAFQAVQHVCWAITPEGLETILAIANRESTDAMLAAALERREQRYQTVAAQDGRPLDGTSLVTMRDGVAVLGVTGPIVRYADIFSEISGATSVQSLARDFTRALNDPSVSAILINTDSPGGEVSGISEFAAMLYAARGQKPISAYISDLGASAAYWIASATDAIVVADTALVGSIGVVAAVPDPTKTSAKQLTFVSSQSPRKRSDPTTESGKQDIQTVVDDLAAIFVDAVALHRGVSADTVLSDFGQGGVFVGQHAVTAGLADRVGTFEQTLTDLQQRARAPRIGTAARRAATTQEPVMANLKDMFKAMFSAMDETEVGVEQAAATEPETTPVAGVVMTTLTASVDPEVERLRTELARVKAEQISKDAAAFAETVIGAHRAYPAERGALMDAFTQAAMDDQTSGVGAGQKPRTALLQATVDARPAHQLTEELIPAGQTVHVLGNLQVTNDADKPVSEERRKSLLRMTAAGQTAANSKN